VVKHLDTKGTREMTTQALLTDLYELTMMAGYLAHGKAGDSATFDLYYRHSPFRGGYAIAAGLEPAVRAVMGMRFSAEDIEYLRSIRTPAGTPLFQESFLESLASFRFHGDIRAVEEGTVVFANEPLMQVSGRLGECQILESILLCIVNFQTLIATKAARLWDASRHGTILEFGMRRAQGPDGSLSACRAAYIGGVAATSNVLGAATFGLPPKGTHAHSWIQSFPTELDAFRAFAHSFPKECVLLVDTYDVLRSGVPNSIKVAKELEAEGERLSGIRIDSGDLSFLSQRAREMLDAAGLHYVKIVVSNEVDEYVITEIISQGGRVDIWGIGTQLVTGGGVGGGALGGVYKLVEHNGQPRIKLSSNPEKVTTPGSKKIVRFYDSAGFMEADAIAPVTEPLDTGPVVIVDPINPLRRKRLESMDRVALLREIVKDGALTYDFPSLDQTRRRRAEQLAQLHGTYRRLRNPHEYKVGLTEALWHQKEMVIGREMV
jgi:nicotinate phosphoribosyltransferase